MATFYEVQELTVSGWVNTWNHQDNWAYYNTREEAQEDIDYHIQSCIYAYNEGRMMDVPLQDSYRIVEVADSVALKGL